MPDKERIVVLGATGQVGRALVRMLGDRCVPLERGEADLSQPALLAPILELAAPSAVINAAAYTQVDKAESDEELATIINGEAPGVIASWCAERNIPFVHYSTDYVFPGIGTRPWSE